MGAELRGVVSSVRAGMALVVAASAAWASYLPCAGQSRSPGPPMFLGSQLEAAACVDAVVSQLSPAFDVRHQWCRAAPTAAAAAIEFSSFL